MTLSAGFRHIPSPGRQGFVISYNVGGNHLFPKIPHKTVKSGSLLHLLQETSNSFSKKEGDAFLKKGVVELLNSSYNLQIHASLKFLLKKIIARNLG